MSDRIIYSSDSLMGASSELNRLAAALEKIAGDLSHVNTSEGWWSKVQLRTGHGIGSARAVLGNLRSDTIKARQSADSINEGVRKTRAIFDEAEERICANADSLYTGTVYEDADGDGTAKPGDAVDTEAEKKKGLVDLLKQFLKELGFTGKMPIPFALRKLLQKAGPFGGLFKAIGDMINADSWGDIGKGIADGWKSVYDGYLKFMKATGGENPTGMKQFWKDLFGLSTKKTADYMPGKFFSDFTGANGATKCVCSWASVLFMGVDKLAGNLREQKDSDGKMTGEQVAFETIVETATDFALTKGAEMAVGAGMTAAATALGFAGAPVILVGAGAAVVVAGVNALVKWGTGKSASEWVADAVWDAYDGSGVQKAVHTVADKAGKVVKKAGDAVVSGFKSFCKWGKGVVRSVF